MSQTPPPPWLTIVLPTYNGAEYIRDALDSLVAQTETGFEIIALDEASSDGTQDIINEYADRLPIRQVEASSLHGWIQKTNRGFDLAKTSYVTMLHQDDFWHPQRMRHIRSALDTVSEPVFLVHSVDYVDATGNPIGLWSPPKRLGEGKISSLDLLQSLCVQNFVAIPGSIFPSQIARDVAGIDPELPYTGDWDFYLKISAKLPGLIVRERLSAYRIHVNSLTLSAASDSEFFSKQLAEPLKRHLDKIPAHQRQEIEAQAEFSNVINSALAGRAFGVPFPWVEVMRHLKRLGPRGVLAYFDKSRIRQRLMPRIRVRLKGRL